jgi:alpha-ketoglutarate-dependent taurine dioxygenase
MKIEPLSDDTSLPMVVTPSTPADQAPTRLMGWLRDAEPEWKGLVLRSGGILFRGFKMTGATDLEHIVRAVSAQPLNYIGGNSPRTRVSEKVYTSTEYPADQIITLHNELSYAPSWPMKILFWCEKPAADGGETPIMDSRLVLRLLPNSLVDRFQARGLIYLQTLHDGAGLGRSWQSTFETADRSAAEQFLNKNGVEFEWTERNGLRIRYHRKALEPHPTTGEMLWFNQADQWHPSSLDAETRKLMESIIKIEDFPHNVVFGDGSPICEEDIATIRNTLWDSAVVFPWQQGDLLLLDNMLVAHGRRRFKGPRKVYVTMA